MMVLGMNLGVGERSSRSQSRGWRRRNPDTQTGAASSNATVSICTDPEFGEKQIRIVSWNCRKLDQVGWDLWEIDRTLADVDVVVLQEVGKYTTVVMERGDWTLICESERWKIGVWARSNIALITSEVRGVTSECPGKWIQIGMDLVVGCVYLPPARTVEEVSSWMSEVEGVIVGAQSQNKCVITAGDWNARVGLARLGFENEERVEGDGGHNTYGDRVVEMVDRRGWRIATGLGQDRGVCTYFRGGIGVSRPDHFIITSTNMIGRCRWEAVRHVGDASDHSMIVMTAPLKAPVWKGDPVPCTVKWDPDKRVEYARCID